MQQWKPGQIRPAFTALSSLREMKGQYRDNPSPVNGLPFTQLANDTLYGLGAGVWTRDNSLAYHMARGIQAGRVWVNCYHQYPAHAAFGGYKSSGVGRENHKMMLETYPVDNRCPSGRRRGLFPRRFARSTLPHTQPGVRP